MDNIESKFCDFLKKWIKEQKKQKKITQNRLAALFEISPQHLSNILAGRRCSDETWRRSVSEKIGVPYETMIGLKEPFEDYYKIMQLPIVERAWAIFRQAGKVYGITDYLSSFGAKKNKKHPKFMQKYLSGEQTEQQLYKESLLLIEEIVKDIKEVIKKRGIE